MTDKIAPAATLIAHNLNDEDDRITIRLRRILTTVGNFHDPAVSIHFDPVSGLNDFKGILVQIGDCRNAHDHGAERDLGCQFSEDYGQWSGAREPRRLKVAGPT